MKMRHQGVSLLKGGAFTIYAIFKLLPKQRKLVLISRLNTKTSIDFQQIVATAADIDPNLRVVVLNHKMSNRLLHVFEIIQEMYHLATAQACVVESYVISVSILKHRKSLVIVQIWHALGAVKAFGHMAIGRPEGSSAEIARLMNMHKNYSYVTVGSSKTIPIYAKAFNVDESIIKPIGMPRLDYLLNPRLQQQNIQAVRKHYNLPADKKIILYAPTFRKRSKIPYDTLIDAIDLSRYTLIIKQHLHDKTHVEPRAGVIINKSYDILQLLPVADYVVTDYSAAVFEAALLKKPLFFWHFDEERYAKRRGFALDYVRELPGVKSSDIQKIVQAIDANDFNEHDIKAFADKYVTIQDGTSTKRLFDLLGITA